MLDTQNLRKDSNSERYLEMMVLGEYRSTYIYSPVQYTARAHNPYYIRPSPDRNSSPKHSTAPNPNPKDSVKAILITKDDGVLRTP